MYSAEAQGESSFMITQHAKQCNTQKGLSTLPESVSLSQWQKQTNPCLEFIFCWPNQNWPILSEIDNNCDIARATAAKMH